MTERTATFTPEELRERLTPMQFHVTQEAGTERPFTGETWDNHEAGAYRCVVCDAELFSSDTKFESGSGWPSFTEPVDGGAVETESDRSLGMIRTEVMCRSCGAHLGHVFPDGPRPTGDRFCMNSASLCFISADDEDATDTSPIAG
ncbi:peptide-methionine (R)-S-oxide reductase MsrB [Candidatus Poriferisodalis sp.]|uniref:peptide-methionine (R)-S-oxide reductase MsrB n=1 Tax=Candidatus Poriferisodalis sp. TaxID=3101277 RepID=UPI003D151E96